MKFWVVVSLVCVMFLGALPSFAQGVSPSEMAESLEFMAHEPIEINADQRATLGQVENYLSSLTTIMSEFIQVSPAGDLAAGKFYLMRPGKLRLQYDPPTPILMVTAGDFLVYHDYELKQVNYIDMDETLIGFLARSQIRFDDTVKVIDLTRVAGAIRITLIQTKKPKDGMLTLEFSDKPIALRNMVITDAAGQRTTMSLNNAKFGIKLDDALFEFKDPNLGGSNKRQKKKLPQ